MNKHGMGFLLIFVLVASFGAGYFLADVFRNYDSGTRQQKPVLQLQDLAVRIDETTPIVFEKEYLMSRKIIISDFENKAGLIGLTVDEIKEKYSPVNGFRVVYDKGSLLIHQTVNDWCPKDKGKYRMKVYQGMIAIYHGPDKEHDSLLRVTAIRLDTLPPQIQQEVTEGAYEFINEQALNDALENMDEYLP